MAFSQTFVRRLVRYRTWGVATANAGVTWVVLIIAPLGLFAVIVCTLGVFLGSLAVGWLSDRALSALLEAGGWTPLTVGVSEQRSTAGRSGAVDQLPGDE